MRGATDGVAIQPQHLLEGQGLSRKGGPVELIECQHRSFGQVRFDELEAAAGRLVEIKVKIGQRDHGLRLTSQIGRQRLGHIPLHQLMLDDMVQRAFRLMGGEQLGQMLLITGRHPVGTGLDGGIAAILRSVGGEAAEGIESHQLAVVVVGLIHAAKRGEGARF